MAALLPAEWRSAKKKDCFYELPKVHHFYENVFSLCSRLRHKHKNSRRKVQYRNFANIEANGVRFRVVRVIKY